MIRLLDTTNFEELESICRLGKEFCEAVNTNTFDKLSFLKFVHNLLSKKIGKVFVLDINNEVVGMLGVAASPCFYNNNVLRVQECFWWITPEHRNSRESIKLFNKVEEWAKEINAHQIMVSSTATLNPEKLEKFYIKKGFKKVDINYVKDVKNA
jgi:N-acetylglutamate synthase-like GNAT family acetyltransferase